MEVPWPTRGISDDLSLSEQLPLTCRDARNVRNRSPFSSRSQGAQRSGQTKYSASAVTAGFPVRHMADVVYGNKTVSYAELASLSTTAEKQATTPSATDSFVIATDRQSNVYATDGPSGVVAYNSEMTEIGRFSLPTQGENDSVRALTVDRFDRVYAGVTVAVEEENGRVWQYRRVPDDEFEQGFEIAPFDEEERPEGYRDFRGLVMDLAVVNDRLYVLTRIDSEWISELYQFSGLGSAFPVLEWKRDDIPYPANLLDVNEAGEVVVTCEQFDNRGRTPSAPEFGPTIVGFEPIDLTDFQDRIYRWHDASDEDTVITTSAKPEDGAEVLQWLDKSGNDRTLEAGLVAAPGGGVSKPPTYSLKAAAGKPGIHFDGVDQIMVSGTNPDIEEASKDNHNSLLPGWTGSQFAVVMAIRPSKKESSPQQTTDQQTVFWQNNTGSTILANDHSLFTNRQASQVFTGGGIVAEGRVSYFDEVDATDPGEGPVANPGSNTQPSDGGFDNAANIAIVTIFDDGGIDPSTIPPDQDDTKTRSLVRVNGVPYDRWESAANSSLGPGYLGGTIEQPLVGWFEGDILEILVFEPRDTVVANEKLLTHPNYPDGNFDVSSDTELEKLEGYLGHKWGAQIFFDDGATYSIINPDTQIVQTSPFAHPYRTTVPKGPDDDEDLDVLVDPDALVAKFGEASGRLKWAIAENEGLGFGVRFGPDESHVFCVGPSDIGGGQLKARRLIDEGDTVSDLGIDGAWEVSLGATTLFKFIRMAVDNFSNLYVPIASDGGGGDWGVRVLQPGSGTTEVQFDFSQLVGENQPTYSVALPQELDGSKLNPKNPEYEDDPVDRSEICFLSSGVEDYNGTGDLPNVHRVRLVEVTQLQVNPRAFRNVAVAGGELKVLAAGTYSSPTGGGPSTDLDSDARFIDSAILNGELFLTDGRVYLAYDAKTDTVSELISESSGGVPERCEIMASWGGRLVLARSADNPAAWFLSEKGDPRTWDFLPPIPEVTQAVSGVLSRVRAIPDIINTFIPQTDDIGVFGCDSSIWRVAGDPAAGGEIEQMSGDWGMAFGRPWCRTPDNVVFFFASRGGLFAISPGGQISWISEDNIQRRLEDIDLSTFRVELAYNWLDRAIHIHQIPYDPTTSVDEPLWWVYELDAGRLVPWEDSAAAAGLQAHSLLVSDQDDFDDRALLIGCQDGLVRKWDRDARDDDGQAIRSRATIGPILPKGGDFDYGYNQLQGTFVDSLDGVVWDLFATDTPDLIGAPDISGTFSQGHNPPSLKRARGAYGWVRIGNNTVGQAWALQRLTVAASPFGPRRVRVNR